MKFFPTVLFAGLSALCSVVQALPVKLIFDTDYRTDVDDPGALAMLHGLADLGQVEIVGIVTSTNGANVVGAIDATNTFCGRPNIPIGLCSSSLASGGGDPYAATIANAAIYPHDQKNATAPDAVRLYRSLLHAATSKNIVINVVGGQNVVHALMNSAANYQNDGIPYSGMQLIAAKVSGLSIMGGNFLNGSVENNLLRGLAAAQQVAAQWPGPIVYSGWEVGNKVPTGAVLSNPAVNPVAKAYEVFAGSGPVGTIGNRDSWDQTSSLQAVIGLDWQSTRVWDLSAPQTITFDGLGRTTATPNPSGNRYYLIKRMADANIAAVISNLMRDGTALPSTVPIDGMIAWYLFDEYTGGADPGAPIINLGGAGSDLNLTNTGGGDGRNNTGAGGYGADGHSGYGFAFDVLASGDGTRHSGSAGSAVGGGLLTASAVPQSRLQGADGAFTYEAFVRIPETTTEQTILSHDGPYVRGFLFRVVGGKLSLYTGAAEVTATIPISGTHAFAAGQWFHVAVTYNGTEGVTNNTRFYWSALGASPALANLIGSATLAADLDGTTSNFLGIGTTTRGFFRFELGGLVDEVGITGHARAADAFEFVTPPPSDTDGDGLPDAWEIEHGLDPAMDNRLGDGDGDGIVNLLEFAFGLDPRVRNSNALPIAALENNYLTLTITRDPEAAGLRFIPEVSTNLLSWNSGASWIVVLEDTPTRLRVRDALPMTTGAARFMRLRVEPPTSE